MLTRPALRSRLSCARRVRISLARCNASIRWVSERSGAATAGLGGVLVAGGMGGESTSRTRGDKEKAANSAEPQVEVQPHGGHLTVTLGFAGLFHERCAIRAAAGSEALEKSPEFAPIPCNSAAIRAPAHGSRNDSVPTATRSAPASSRSRP